jgi:hypothetical protein
MYTDFIINCWLEERLLFRCNEPATNLNKIIIVLNYEKREKI